MCRVGQYKFLLFASYSNGIVLYVLFIHDFQASVQKVLQKLADVQEMFEKRQASLKKLAAKQTRPVQPVAPHPESSPKRASPKTTRPTSLGKMDF